MVTDYQVTTPYGWVEGYPLHTDPSHPGQGFHQGIDYGCPTGTPVVVNGVQIGLSGSTGESTGPHCHIGVFINGVVQDPGVGNGLNFNNAVVYDTGSDDLDGNYVRISADGALWNYLHLSQINVSKGQLLTEEEMSTIGEVEFNDLFRAFFGDINLVKESDRKAWIGGESNTVIRSMAADPRFQPTPAPEGVTPYTGPQLYTKE